MAKKLTLPRIHVMVICDEIESSVMEEDVFDLAGVRSTILVETFPYTQTELSTYLQMTGHEGSTRCHLEVLSARTDDVVYVTKPQKVNLHGPLFVVPVIFRLRNCSFPDPGLYYVQAYCDQKLLCERLLHLMQI